MFVGADQAEATVEPAVVVPIDPSGGRELDVRDRLVRVLVEHRRADALGVVEAVDGLHERIVVRVTDGPDRGSDALEREVLSEANRRVLGAGVRVTDDLVRADRAVLSLAFSKRHPPWCHDEIDPLPVLRVPGDDALREHVEDERHIHPACAGADVGEVGHPGVIGARGQWSRGSGNLARMPLLAWIVVRIAFARVMPWRPSDRMARSTAPREASAIAERRIRSVIFSARTSLPERACGDWSRLHP